MTNTEDLLLKGVGVALAVGTFVFGYLIGFNRGVVSGRRQREELAKEVMDRGQ